MPRVPHPRFATENLAADLGSADLTISSEDASFLFSNAVNSIRTKVWKCTGHFEVSDGSATYYNSQNDQLYINDGSNKTITVTAGQYSTPAALATQLQTDLNASSSNWTVAYSTTTNKFTISNTGSVTIRLSQTTNSIWNDIGYTTSSDLTGTSFEADQARNHTDEYVIFDFGIPTAITFFALINPIGTLFPISDAAQSIKLQADNVDVWTSPALDLSLTRTSGGLFRFNDDQTTYSYRYWRVYFKDWMNAGGSETFQFSHLYLGEYSTFNDRPSAYGYKKTIQDNSQVSESIGGTRYFDVKKKQTLLSDVIFEHMERANKDELERLFYRVGIDQPFYLSLDPLLNYTDSIDELTRYVQFLGPPEFTHTIKDMYTARTNYLEVI